MQIRQACPDTSQTLNSALLTHGLPTFQKILRVRCRNSATHDSGTCADQMIAKEPPEHWGREVCGGIPRRCSSETHNFLADAMIF